MATHRKPQLTFTVLWLGDKERTFLREAPEQKKERQKRGVLGHRAFNCELVIGNSGAKKLSASSHSMFSSDVDFLEGIFNAILSTISACQHIVFLSWCSKIWSTSLTNWQVHRLCTCWKLNNIWHLCSMWFNIVCTCEHFNDKQYLQRDGWSGSGLQRSRKGNLTPSLCTVVSVSPPSPPKSYYLAQKGSSTGTNGTFSPNQISEGQGLNGATAQEKSSPLFHMWFLLGFGGGRLWLLFVILRTPRT